jgi:hypothetical protein
MARTVDGDGADASLDPEGHTAFDIWIAVGSPGRERRIIGKAYNRVRNRVYRRSVA